MSFDTLATFEVFLLADGHKLFFDLFLDALHTELQEDKLDSDFLKR